jgi:hypothetical protein
VHSFHQEPEAPQKQLLQEVDQQELQQQQQQYTSRKRSRKEMERALRHGNLDAVMDDSQFVSLEQSQPDSYTPQPETYAVPQYGIRVAATAMYDPSQGAAVTGVKKGRGKNQINHLMASAANLELQRARQGNSNIGKMHRANAKQKYGW